MSIGWIKSRTYWTDRLIEMDTETLYRTRELEEAAAVWAGGAEFVGLEAISHRSFRFLFTPAADAERLVREFQGGSLTVNARRYADCLAQLKDAIFNRLRDRNGDDNAYNHRRDH